MAFRIAACVSSVQVYREFLGNIRGSAVAEMKV